MSVIRTRRAMVKAASWSAPVILLSVNAPATVASGPTPEEPEICGLVHDAGNNGTFLVYTDKIIVQYKTAPDIYEANVQYDDGSRGSFGTNYGTAPARGSLVWTIALPKRAAWVQIHGFNDHYGEVC